MGKLSAEFTGWRFGRGGSGHWWAVRHNDCVRALSVDDLRARLREYTLAPSAPSVPPVPVQAGPPVRRVSPVRGASSVPVSRGA